MIQAENRRRVTSRCIATAASLAVVAALVQPGVIIGTQEARATSVDTPTASAAESRIAPKSNNGDNDLEMSSPSAPGENTGGNTGGSTGTEGGSTGGSTGGGGSAGEGGGAAGGEAVTPPAPEEPSEPEKPVEPDTPSAPENPGDSSSEQPPSADPKLGATATVSGITYKVSAKGQVTITKLSKAAKAKKTLAIPATVKVKGKSCKVVGIMASLLKGSKATTLVVKTKLLTKKSVKNALKGSKVTTVKVAVSSKKSTNKSYIAKYKKIFTAKICGKKIAIK